MAKHLTAGQQAAIRAAITRRGELGLTQKELASATGVAESTIQNMESFRSWPRSGTRAQLEQLGLGWPLGYLAEFAAKIDARGNSNGDEVERARATVAEMEAALAAERARLAELQARGSGLDLLQAAGVEAQRRLAEIDDRLGEEQEGRDIA